MGSWSDELCIHCDQFGHCPRRFWDEHQHIGVVHRCLCHKEFGHCLQKTEKKLPNLKDLGTEGFSASIPGMDPQSLDINFTATTMQPEIVDALGYEVKLGANLSATGERCLSWNDDKVITDKPVLTFTRLTEKSYL